MKTNFYRFLGKWAAPLVAVIIIAISFCLSGCNQAKNDQFDMKPIHTYTVTHANGVDTVRADKVWVSTGKKSGYAKLLLNDQYVGVYVWSEGNAPVQLKAIQNVEP